MLDDLSEVVKNWWMRRQPRLTPVPVEEDAPLRKEITFVPFDDEPTMAMTFLDITENWIKSQSGESIYRRATEYVRRKRVKLLETSATHIKAKTRGTEIWAQELSLENGQLITVCGCSARNTGVLRPGLGPCHHSTAVLIAKLHSLAPSTSAATPAATVCPVTRQALKPGMKLYRCRMCQMPYSAEGWQFLREMSNAECCGCGHRETVILTTS